MRIYNKIIATSAHPAQLIKFCAVVNKHEQRPTDDSTVGASQLVLVNPFSLERVRPIPEWIAKQEIAPDEEPLYRHPSPWKMYNWGSTTDTINCKENVEVNEAGEIERLTYLFETLLNPPVRVWRTLCTIFSGEVTIEGYYRTDTDPADVYHPYAEVLDSMDCAVEEARQLVAEEASEASSE